MNIPSPNALIASLGDPAIFPRARHVSILETHISWIVLAGREAYKIKKSLDLGFLDFTTLDARKFFCEEEIRLNRRLAPDLYRDVVAIGGSAMRPRLGGQPAIEYAVRMRRFAADNLMDRQLALGRVTPVHMDSLADLMAHFHAGLPPAPQDSPYGTLGAIHEPMAQNFVQLKLLSEEQLALERLHEMSEQAFAECRPVFAERRRQGCIRECHGDLHLGNIVMLRGVPTPFDGIEFNAALRWIDVMNEVAFLVMDLLHRDRADLAFRFLNRYLENSGDYRGTSVLRFYAAYRATVRAKIAAIRARQTDTPATEAERSLADRGRYLELAQTWLAQCRPALILMHGLPGSGKTSVAQHAQERLQGIRMRSDVERKRLHGLMPFQSSGGDIYTPEATRRTYDSLLEHVGTALKAGFPVIVDAAFLLRAERDQFLALADRMALPVAILSVQANDVARRQRILHRMVSEKDASEADLTVLDKLRGAQESLSEAEMAHTVMLHNDDDKLEGIAENPAWKQLEKMLV